MEVAHHDIVSSANFAGIMELTDTHIHLYAEEYFPDQQQLIEQAIKSGVKKFLMPNVDISSIEGMHKLSENYKDICVPMMGLHPCNVKADYKDQLAVIEKHLRQGYYCAAGEIGLDKYWDLEFISQQEEVLIYQLQLAHELNLPVSLHTRNATEEVISIIQNLNLKNLRGVFHCFSGNIEQAKTITNMGFYLGIGGVVTFKNSGLDKVVEEIALENLVLETDGPYLAPVPYRGKRNEPEYIKLIAEKIAAIKNLFVDEVADITSANAKKLFHL